MLKKARFQRAVKAHHTNGTQRKLNVPSPRLAAGGVIRTSFIVRMSLRDKQKKTKNIDFGKILCHSVEFSRLKTQRKLSVPGPCSAGSGVIQSSFFVKSGL